MLMQPPSFLRRSSANVPWFSFALCLVALCLLAVPNPSNAAAQTANATKTPETNTPVSDNPTAGSPTADNPRTSLSVRQSSVADRYQKLEELLLRLAEMESAENPERAALLRRAARQSSDQFILNKLKTASQSLETQEFQKAIDNQDAAKQDLGNLLTLLMSEDRSERIRNEKERVQRLVKDLKRTLNNQRSVRARTENGADLNDVAEEQKSVTERGEELSEELEGTADNSSEKNPRETGSDDSDGDNNESPKQPSDASEEASGEQNKDAQPSENPEGKPPSDSQDPGSSEAENSETNQDQGNPQEEEPQSPPDGDDAKDTDTDQSPDGEQSSESSDSPPPSSDSQQSPSSPPQSDPSQSDPSQSSPSEPSDSSPSESGSPEQKAQENLKKAIEKMQQAEQELEEAKRSEATEKQREAEENLREAIDQLEQILRQLREEEMQRELARLESRLKKIATMQTKVLDDTVNLASTPKSQRNRQTDLKAGELSFEEKKITLEADRALLLLREEGSSVAFPEVVGQIRADTNRVAELLNETKIDTVCQGIQQDILAALEEMIASLQKAQRDLEQQRQQEQPPGNPPPSGQQEQPLVEAIAELKLIRTMQVRIKTTTDRYSGLIDEQQSTVEEVLPLLRDLAERQDRLDQITRDIALKRNQ